MSLLSFSILALGIFHAKFLYQEKSDGLFSAHHQGTIYHQALLEQISELPRLALTQAHSHPYTPKCQCVFMGTILTAFPAWT